MPYVGLDSPSTSPSAPVANEPTAVLSDAPSTTASLAGGVSDKGSVTPLTVKERNDVLLFVPSVPPTLKKSIFSSPFCKPWFSAKELSAVYVKEPVSELSVNEP